MKQFKQLALAFSLIFACTFVFAQDGDLPPNAVPGKCYAKCLVPDQYETVSEQILVKEGSKRLEILPAQYETVEEQVLVKEGYTVYEIVPPTYTTVEEEVMVKEASTRLEYIPPVYETVTEQILVSPASTKWTKGKADMNCLQSGARPEDCKVWCLSEVPAQYRTVSRQVLKSPATTREIPIPAEYRTITKTVLQTPAQVKEVAIDPEYRTITRQVLKSPSTTEEIEIPAEYTTVSSQKLVTTGGFTDWVEVLCETKMTTARIIAIQQALKAKGYDPGPVDDILGPRTRAALIQFQKDNGLPVGNLNMETLGALGVE